MEIRLVEQPNPQLPREFALILIAVGAFIIQYLVTMYAFTMSARIKTFTKDFMKKFEEEHKKAFPNAKGAPKGGYPDCGSGYFSKHLSYGGWMTMNKGQRCQIGFLETIPYVIMATLTSSLIYPQYALISIWTVFFGRFIFSVGYMKGGNKARFPGAIVGAIANMMMLLPMFIYVVYQHARVDMAK